MNGGPVDDLVFYVVLFVILLLACALLVWLVLAAGAARRRWGPREVEPMPDERIRAAVLQLQSVGVDVRGLLGEWSPVDN
jgi:hypothetical protein